VDDNIKSAEKMEAHAENTYKALNHLLDLKQKEANSWDTQFARDQSEHSARQGNIILLFTVVTIIFLPLTFLSSFFALDIAQFPTEWQLSKVSKYIFGISFGTSALLILIAASANRVKEVWTDSDWGRGRGRGRGQVQWAGFRWTIPFFGRRDGDPSYNSDDLSPLTDWDDPYYSQMSSTTVWSQEYQVRDRTTGFDLDGVGFHRRGTVKDLV